METILREGWPNIIGAGVAFSLLYSVVLTWLYRSHRRRVTMRRMAILWTMLGCLLSGLWLWWLTSWPVFVAYMLAMALFGLPHMMRAVAEWLEVYIAVTESATREATDDGTTES